MPKLSKKAKEPMHHLDIRFALLKKEHTYASIARHFEINPVTVRAVCTNQQKSHRIATYIAELLDMPINDIWPDVYNYTARESYKQRIDNARAVA